MKKKRKKKKGFSLKEQYRECWDFIKESKIFIYVVMAVFFVFALIGYFVPAPESIVEVISEFIEELLRITEGMSLLELMGYIFLNNLQSSFFAMVLGVLLGLVPLILAAINGYLLGFVALLSVQSQSIFVLWRIFPHGVFELPAVFISLGLGTKLGTFIFKKKKIESFKHYLSNSLRILIFIVIPLLAIGAAIETILIFIG